MEPVVRQIRISCTNTHDVRGCRYWIMSTLLSLDIVMVQAWWSLHSSCSKAIPINGSCGGKKDTCSGGTFEDGSVSNSLADTSTHYRWKCKGQHSGTDANCEYNKPVNGTCSTTTKDACTAGTFKDEVDTSTNYNWSCLGQYGGANSKICTKAVSIDGVCDNTERNGCSKGTANDAAVNDDSTYYKWRCAGLNGGSNVDTCQVRKAIDGSCSGTLNQCLAGTFKDIVDTEVYHAWACVGQYEGATQFCHKRKPEAGVCGALKDTCHGGDYVSGTDTQTEHKWSCNGKYGSSTNISCSLTKNVVVSVAGKPTGLQLVYTGSSLRLSWLEPTNRGGLTISDYEVQWAVGNTAPSTWPAYSQNNSVCESRNTHCMLSDKATSTTGHIRVRAINGLGNGAWSDNKKIIWGNSTKAMPRAQRIGAGRQSHLCGY